jgi:hypothetical protein
MPGGVLGGGVDYGREDERRAQCLQSEVGRKEPPHGDVCLYCIIELSHIVGTVGSQMAVGLPTCLVLISVRH